MLKLLPFVQSFCVDLHQPGRGRVFLFDLQLCAWEVEVTFLHILGVITSS